jgi:hypothetical protein
LLWLIKLDLLPDLDFRSDSLDGLVGFDSVRRINNNNPRKCIFLEHSYFVKLNVEELNYTLSENKDIYLVLFEGSPLDKYFHFRELTECYKGHICDREFEKGGFRIYHKRLLETLAVR